MEKEIKELIRNNENDLSRYKERQDNIRNNLKFCSEHKFSEEARISILKLDAMDGIIYDYEQMIKDLKIILKSAEKELLKNAT